MAKPRSDDKYRAILDAAARCVAEDGVGVATARIARAAGVADGTIFTYFPTKDALLAALFSDIEAGLAAALRLPEDGTPTPRDGVRFVWDALIDWSIAHPTQRAALLRLKASRPLDGEMPCRTAELFQNARDAVERGLTGHAEPARIQLLVDTILFGLADTIGDAILAGRGPAATLRQLGFDLFWNGAARRAPAKDLP